MFDNTATVLHQFVPISLSEMNDVSLMRRVDTKYIIHCAQLPLVLASVSDQYSILEIDQLRTMRYESQYFDTATCRFFNDHHNGKAGRTKVRIRAYIDTGLCFLEIKRKNAKGVMQKKRMKLQAQQNDLSAAALKFIDERTTESFELQPTIRNRFQRLTLVDAVRSERVTLDWGLSSHLGSVYLEHHNLAIIEIKQERYDRHAPIVKALKAIGARPYRVSKYCLGMACLRADLKTNRFKPKILHIDNITSQRHNPLEGDHGISIRSAV